MTMIDLKILSKEDAQDKDILESSVEFTGQHAAEGRSGGWLAGNFLLGNPFLTC